MIATTYPAAMAGICLTTLAIISSQFYVSKVIVCLLVATSLAFITSSFFIFLHVVLIEGGGNHAAQKIRIKHHGEPFQNMLSYLESF